MTRSRAAAFRFAVALGLAACGPRDLTPRVDSVALQYLADTMPPAAWTIAAIRSPDQRYLAWNDQVDNGLLRLKVSDLTMHDTTVVITIGESDPGSGASHAMRWTADGRAVLVVGSGRLDKRPAARVCFVYRVQERDLLTPPSCPADGRTLNGVLP